MSRDHFIPFRKSDLAAMCVLDGRVAAEDVKAFTDFCAILRSVIHFEFHERLERLKDLYAPFDPTADTRPLEPLDAAAAAATQSALVKELEDVLGKANFQRISAEDLNRALSEESVFRVQLHTELDDFAELILHSRGLRSRKETMSDWFGLRKRDILVDYYERVAIYVRFQDANFFKAKKPKLRLSFIPGSTVLKLFQNIPTADLEMLFPNVDVRMKLKDHALLGVPALLGTVTILAKLGASLVFVCMLLAYWLGVHNEPVDAKKTELVALGIGLFSLTMFLIRQVGKFKSRKIVFMKALTDNLYYRNLDNNAGVFHHIIDAAEEEECKEVILAYVFLRAVPTGLTEAELDTAIEKWFRERWRVEIDFEVDDALKKLERLQLAVLNGDRWQANPLAESLTKLDQRWDEFFVFAPAAISDKATVVAAAAAPSN